MYSFTSMGINRKARRGFTLVEMLIVIAIIALLMGLGIAAMAGIKRNTNNVITFTRIKTLYLALESFKNEFGYYPEPQKDMKDGTGKDISAEQDNYITLKSKDVPGGIITPDFREHFAVSQDILDDKNRVIDAYGAPLVYKYTRIVAPRLKIYNDEKKIVDMDADMIHPVIFIYSLGPDGKADEDDSSDPNNISVWPRNPPNKARKANSDDPLDINDGAPPFGVNNDNIYYNRKGD